MTEILNNVDKELSETVTKAVIGAPAIHTNGKASVIKEITSKTGKSLEQVLFGSDTNKDGAEASVELTNGVYKNFVDSEAIAETVQLKKDLWAAAMQAKFLGCSVENTPYYKHILGSKLKAYDLATMTNFTPAMNTQFYVSEFQGIYAGLQDIFVQQAMKSKTEDIRSLTGILEGALVLDDDTFTAQSQGQSSSQLSAKGCVASAKISTDLLLDASPAAFNDLLSKMVDAVRVAEENAIINGATSGTQDSSTPASGAAGSFVRAFNGLRYLALNGDSSVKSALGTAWSLTAIQNAVRQLGNFAVDPSKVALITDVRSANAIKTGIISELLTYTNAGTRSLLSQTSPTVTNVLGYDLLQSSKSRKDLNASGVYDATTTTKTALIAVNKERFVVGRRGGYKVWSTPTLADQDQVILSAKSRMAFAPVMPQSSTETAVSIVYNITAP